MRAGKDPYKFAVVSLILSMAVVAVLVASASIAILYRAAYREDLIELQGATDSLASVIEAVAQFDLLHSSSDHPRGSWGATMSQIERALALQQLSSPTAEVAIASLEGGEVLIRRRDSEGSHLFRMVRVGSGSPLGALVQRAFAGERGAVELSDFLGEASLVGFARAPSLQVVVLVRIGLDEVRAPYVSAGLWAGVVALVGIALGAATSLRLARPLKLQADLQEKRLEALVSAAPVGVFEMDAHQACIYVNEQWSAQTGLSLEEARGDGWRVSLHPDDMERAIQSFARYLAGDGTNRLSFRVRRPDGQVAWMLGQVSTLRDAEGRVLGYIGTTTDITLQKRIEEELQASVREKETLLHEVHHRVKNNLQVIASLIYFQAKKVESAKDREIFADLRARLVAMTLVHERLYRSKDLARVDLGQYLKELVDALLQSMTDGGRVRAETRADEVRFPLDRALYVGMLVCELVTNIVKYAFPNGASGKALLHLTRSETQAFLVVEDDGVGFPPGFDFRTAQSFGWTVVRNLADQLGASVEVESERASGARVTLKLPLEPVASSGASAAVPSPGQA